MLKIENLNCGYGSKIILRDINFKINTAEFVGIIGPNGSGKTTLLRAITKVLKPKKGNIFLNKKSTKDLSLKDMARQIAVVSQSVETEDITVQDFVLLGRTPYYKGFQLIETENDLKVAKEALELTGVYKLKDALMSQISGGEKQLALIARALAQEPKLLLLDEPTSHLDISHQVKILDLLRKLNKDFALTVVMVLHDLNLASEYCHKLILVNNGHIHKIGQPQEVINYKTIEEVYKTIVVVKENPISHKPYVLLVSEEEKQKRCLFSQGR